MAVQATTQETFNEPCTASSQVVVTSGSREDKETQIYNNDPHLFVFDKEVSTMVIRGIIILRLQVEVVMESIIGRTLEQSMTEVMQEEEITRAR